uniref:(California timema) hypothetical protein n=1 Tax=Timema californicum TaxID=61474 RepID=A0A7R9PG08_TIMCA|nr:unnamed protein product [Timema californicum]
MGDSLSLSWPKVTLHTRFLPWTRYTWRKSGWTTGIQIPRRS